MNESKKTIFIVDDDLMYAKVIEKYLSTREDLHFEIFTDGEHMLNRLHYNPSLIILDYHLNGATERNANGMAVLNELKALNPTVPVVMLSGLQDVQIAVDLLKFNATDYIVKDANAPKKLMETVNKIFTIQEHSETAGKYKKRAFKVRQQLLISFSVVALIALLLFLF